MIEDAELPQEDEAALDQLFDLAFEASRSDDPRHRQALDAWSTRHPHLATRAEPIVRLASQHGSPRATEMPQLPGYAVFAEIGRGAMGQVFRARDLRLGRDVALKILPPRFTTAERARQRFLLEARSLARVRHANVVPIHEVIEHGDLVAYSMELVPGQTLAAWIRQPGRPPMPIAEVCRIGVQLASALAAMHRANLLHRDVKPSNVLLRDDGTALLSDFGLVRDESAEQHTRTGELLGTPAYASPEQLRGLPLDRRSDVHALGVTLFEMAAGTLPHVATSTEGRLLAIARGDVCRLRQVRRDAPRDLEVIVGKAIETDPAGRYVDAEALAEDLRRLLALQPILAQPPGLAGRFARFVRRHRGSVAAMLATFALTVLAFAWLVVGLQQRARLPLQRAAALQKARVAVLQPDSNSAMFRVAAAGADDSFLAPGSSSRLHAAVAAYEVLASLGEIDIATRREHEVVALADQLLQRRQAPPQESPPHLRELATAFHARQPFPLSSWRTAHGGDSLDAAQRRELGLLAHCLTHFGLAVEVWQGLDLAPDGADPFVEAALGQILLARGEPARAYPRLLRAADAFPEAGFLHVAVADAALACGDVATAARFHEVARAHLVADPDHSLARQAIDLLLAHGNHAEALVRLRDLVHRTEDNPLLLERHAIEAARAGDVEGALGSVERLQVGWSRVGRWQAFEATVLQTWWDTMPAWRRLAVVVGILVPRNGSRRLSQWLDVESGDLLRQRGAIPPLLVQAAHWRRVIAGVLSPLEESMLAFSRRTGWSQSVLALIAWFGGGDAMAQAPTWTQRTPAQSPPPLTDHALVYDAARQEVVLFGGYHYGTQTDFGETWVWNGTDWQQRQPANSPIGRSGLTMVYDSARARVMMFAGYNHTGIGHRRDLWEWDGTNWTLVSMNGPPRERHQAAYDPVRARMVVFGGLGPPLQTPLGDTWEWDGTNWIQASPALSPSPGSSGKMVYDPVRNRCLLVCKAQPTSTQTDTWEWDGTNWLQRTPVPPLPPRGDFGMAWDPSHQRLLLFGGQGAGPLHPRTDTTWSWDGSTWTELCCSAVRPPARRSFAAAFDTVRNVLVIACGDTSLTTPGMLNDTWELTPPATTASAAYGAGCAGGAGVPTLAAVQPPIVGGTFQAQLTNVVPSIAIFVLGLSNSQWGALPLPLPLDGVGFPAGCVLHASPDSTSATLHAGVANWSLGIPCDPSLYGFTFYVQGANLDPSVTSAIQVVLSNGLQVTTGS